MTLHAGCGAVDAFGPGPDPRYAWPVLMAGARACAGAAAASAETMAELPRLRARAASLQASLCGRSG